MKDKLNNIELVISTIIDSSKKHAIASENGEYKIANKNFDIVKKAVVYLRENNGINNLKQLLTYDDESVKLMAATYLLKHFEKESIDVIENIAFQTISNQSFNAKMILQEWYKGNINL